MYGTYHFKKELENQIYKTKNGQGKKVFLQVSIRQKRIIIKNMYDIS